MESIRSTAPIADASLQSLAIRVNENKLAQQNPSSSRAPWPASNKKVISEFKCNYCPCKLATARERGNHEKVHNYLRELSQNQQQKGHRRLDGIHLGGLQDMREVNKEEEATDGIDLTLRL